MKSLCPCLLSVKTSLCVRDLSVQGQKGGNVLSLLVSLHLSHHHLLPRSKHPPPGCDTDAGEPPCIHLTTTETLYVSERKSGSVVIFYSCTFLHMQNVQAKQLHLALYQFLLFVWIGEENKNPDHRINALCSALSSEAPNLLKNTLPSFNHLILPTLESCR